MENARPPGRRLKILLISTNSDNAGAPIHVESLIDALRTEVDLVAAFGEHGPVMDRLLSNGVTATLIPGLRSSIHPRRDLSALLAIHRLAKVFKPDIIHAHSSKAGLLGRLVARNLRIPCIYTVHGWGWRGLGPLTSRVIWLIEKVMSYPMLGGYYIYVSKSVETDGIKNLGIKAPRGRVIYNGARDFGYITEPNTGLNILMPARVTEAKDHETLVKAFEMLAVPSTLTLCGAGTEAPKFAELVKKWAPTKYALVRLMGSRSDVQALMHHSHVFALISNFEALPISIIEAMGAGRAVVATDVGGVSELIQDGANGLLVPKGNISAVAEAITKLADENLRAKLGGHARFDYERNYTDQAMGAHVLDFYRSCVE